MIPRCTEWEAKPNRNCRTATRPKAGTNQAGRRSKAGLALSRRTSQAVTTTTARQPSQSQALVPVRTARHPHTAASRGLLSTIPTTAPSSPSRSRGSATAVEEVSTKMGFSARSATASRPRRELPASL